MRFCDRILLLEQGLVRAVGSSEDLVNIPRQGALIG